MPRLFLHIGTQKTGTTSIQTALSNARTKLLDLGFDYPATESDDAHKVSHYNSFRGFFARDPAQIDATKRFVSRVSASPNNLILSAECLSCFPPRAGRSLVDFWRIKAQAVARIGAAFPNHEHTIIVFTRKEQDFLKSLYHQHLHELNRNDSADEYETFLRSEGHLTDYASEIECWRQTFRDVRIIDYDAISSSVEAFCDVVGIPRLPDRRENITSRRALGPS